MERLKGDAVGIWWAGVVPKAERDIEWLVVDIFGVEQISGDSRQNLQSIDTYVKGRSGRCVEKRDHLGRL
jgi:hypothetical protein